MLRLTLPIASLPLLLLASSGCTPSTPYRYTGLTPAAHPIPWDGRIAPDGTLRAEGTLAVQEVITKPYADVHDTALFVPEITAQGSALLAVTRGFEFGVRGGYSAYRWSQPSTVGTLPLPSRGATWGVGPEVHGGVRFGRDKAFGLGFGGNVLWQSVPFAQWTRVGTSTATCDGGVRCVTDPNGVRYELFTESRETHNTFSLSIVPSYAFGPGGVYGHVFANLGFTTGFANDGFATKAQNNSTITSSGILFTPGVGYGARIADVVHLSGMIFWPVTTYDSPVNYGPGGLFSVGVDFELWEGRERRWLREIERMSEPAYEHGVPPPPARTAPPAPGGEPSPLPAPLPAPRPAPGETDP